jgi:hypothetical protein
MLAGLLDPAPYTVGELLTMATILAATAYTAGKLRAYSLAARHEAARARLRRALDNYPNQERPTP